MPSLQQNNNTPVCSTCILHQQTGRCIRRDKRLAKTLEKEKATAGWSLVKTYQKHEIFDKDVGGEGNCLFYCFADIYTSWVNTLVKPSAKQNELLLQVKKDPLYFRKRISEQFTPAFLLQNARALVAHQKSLPPTLKKEFLASFYKEDGFWLKLGFSENESTQLAQKSSSIEDAAQQAKKMKLKSTQWGGEFDIAQFQKLTSLQIQMLNLQPGSSRLFYCIPNNKQYKYTAIIRNIDMYHYTVAGIQDTKSSPVSSVWKTSLLPDWFTKKVNIDCPETQ